MSSRSPRSPQRPGRGMTYDAAPQPPRWRRAWKLMIEYWWLYLIAFIILFIGTAILLVYVALPKIGQIGVNHARVDLVSLGGLEARPESLKLEMNAILRSDNIFHPTIRPFEVALFLEDTMPNIIPFGYVVIPQVVSQKEVEINVAKTLDIVDMQQFTTFLERVVTQPDTRLALRGRPTLKLGALPSFQVDFNKVIAIPGLNGLVGFGVSDFRLLLNAEADGTNVIGTVVLPNPAPISFEIGTIFFNLHVDDQYVGQVRLRNVTLSPGDNAIPMTAVADLLNLVRLVTVKYTNMVLPVTVQCNATYNNRGEYLSYFTDSLRQLTLHLELDVGKAVSEVGITLHPSPPPRTTTSSLARGPTNARARIAATAAPIA